MYVSSPKYITATIASLLLIGLVGCDKPNKVAPVKSVLPVQQKATPAVTPVQPDEAAIRTQIEKQEEATYGKFLVLMKPIRDGNFSPFSIVSTKLGTEISSDELEKHYLCRTGAIAPTMELIQNYDVEGSDPLDGSMTITSFRGRQNGQDVLVDIWASHSPQSNIRVFVNKTQAIRCG